MTMIEPKLILCERILLNRNRRNPFNEKPVFLSALMVKYYGCMVIKFKQNNNKVLVYVYLALMMIFCTRKSEIIIMLVLIFCRNTKTQIYFLVTINYFIIHKG